MTFSLFYVALFVELLLLTLPVMGLLVFYLRKYKRVASQLRKQLQAQANPLAPEGGGGGSAGAASNAVLNFLQRQALKSHQLSKSPPASTQEGDRALWLLRRAYLQAEESAWRQAEGDEEHYWQLLRQPLQQLLLKLSSSQGGEAGVAQQLEQRVVLLRERVAALKAVGAENRQAQSQLLQANDRIHYLESRTSAGEVSRQNVDMIQRLNERLSGSVESVLGDMSEAELGDLVARLDLRIAEQNRSLDQLNDELLALQDERILDVVELRQSREKLDELLAGREEAEATIQSLRKKLDALGQQSRVIETDAQADQAFWRGGSAEEVGRQSAEQRQQLADGAQDEVLGLRATVSKQRGTMLSLQVELQRLREEGEAEEQSAREQRIGALERLLAESETCIGMLEQELDTLQAQLKPLLTQQDDPAGDDRPQAVIDDLNQELEHMGQLLTNAMAAYGDQGGIVHFAMSCLQCADRTALAREIVAAVEVMGLSAAVELAGRKTVVTASRSLDGSIGKRLHEYRGEGRRINYVDGGVILLYEQLRLFFSTEGVAEEKVVERLDVLNSLLLLSVAFIEKIDSGLTCERQRKALDKVIRSASSSIKGIEAQYKEQVSEATVSVDRLLKEIYMALKTFRMDREQDELFRAIMQDCQERMALMFATGLTIDETMEKLLRSLDQKR